MKNTLAENMLRFGTKLTESDKRKVSRLAEQDNTTYDSILVTNAPEVTNEKDATLIQSTADVVFLGSIKALQPVRQYYAFPSVSDVYMLPIGSNYMLIMGEIGVFKTDKMGKPGEIGDIKYRAFYASHGGTTFRKQYQFDTPGNYQQVIKTLTPEYEKRLSSGRDDFWNTYADGLFSLYIKSGIAIDKNQFYINGKSAAIS
jgi:hypothetical protein